jgi:hypothetical protein
MAHDIYMYRGDTYEFDVTVAKEAGGFYDLTGATCLCTVRTTVDGDQEWQKSGTQGGVTDGIEFNSPATDGVMHIVFEAEDSDAATVRDYKWDVEIQLASGEVITVPRNTAMQPELGDLHLIGEVTRPA